MELLNVPRWYSLGVERRKAEVWLIIRFEPWSARWLLEEELADTASFMGVASQLKENFTHLIPSGTFLPFGFGGIGLIHARQDGGVLKLPLTVPDRMDLVSATLSALRAFFSIEPDFLEKEKQGYAFSGIFQKLIFECHYHDRPQGRHIVGCLSPYMLKRLQRLQQQRIFGRDTVLRRATKTARLVWYGPGHTGFVKGEEEGSLEPDFFADNPFELKDHWFLLQCPGRASGLVTKTNYREGESLMFSGNNLDHAGQQLTVLGALAEICQAL